MARFCGVAVKWELLHPSSDPTHVIYIFRYLTLWLFIDIKHVKVTWTEIIQAYKKFENLKFLIYFLNKAISFAIS